MYLNFYGLRDEPFTISPDPRYLFMSEPHREGLAHLTYGISQRRGFVVITGAVGTGKTTLVQTLLADLPQKVRLAFIANPTLTRDEFFALLAHAFQLGPCENKARFLISFAGFLEQAYRDEENVVLIVDEAHSLSFELFEEIRLLSNLETPHQKLMNIILVGQPELDAMLNTPRLLPLRQRITLRYHLPPLTAGETRHYVETRLLKAGAADLAIFTDDAIERLHRESCGIPRVINILADHALLSGYVKELKKIDEKIVEECVFDLRLHGDAPSAQDATSGETRAGRSRLPLYWGAVGLAVIAAFLLYWWMVVQ